MHGSRHDRSAPARHLPTQTYLEHLHARFAGLAIEPVLQQIVGAEAGLHDAVLDFKRVTTADLPAARMLAALVASCAERGQHVVLTRVRRGELLAAFSSELDPRHTRAVSFQPQLDLGLEWCERGLLERYAATRTASAIAGLAEHRLCIGATADDVAYLEARVARSQFEPGVWIVRRGDPADALYFLMRGEVSVIVGLPQGGFKRLSTLSAGMGFGETALIAGGVRSAEVRADTPVECCTLSAKAFSRLEHERPSLMIRLLHNLAAQHGRHGRAADGGGGSVGRLAKTTRAERHRLATTRCTQGDAGCGCR